MNEDRSRAKLILYIVLRVLIVATMVAQIMNHNWHNVMTCVLTLILLMLPSILSKQLDIKLPTTMEVIIVLFIFSAEILGEIHGFYVMFPRWDDMLHTTNGFLAAAIGFALVDILNRHENVKFSLSPFFVAGVAFCFSMTIGVLWEFFECGMDMFFNTDMQKDTWLTSFNSVAINPDGSNVPVHVEVDSVKLNGMTWERYLDVGLYDTMHDLLVNFIGAVVFSTFGLFYIKNRGKGFAAHFVPTYIKRKRSGGLKKDISDKIKQDVSEVKKLKEEGTEEIEKLKKEGTEEIEKLKNERKRSKAKKSRR